MIKQKTNTTEDGNRDETVTINLIQAYNSIQKTVLAIVFCAAQTIYYRVNL